LQDLDYASAITDLTRHQTELEAAQKSFVNISRLSFFNYVDVTTEAGHSSDCFRWPWDSGHVRLHGFSPAGGDIPRCSIFRIFLRVQIVTAAARFRWKK